MAAEPPSLPELVKSSRRRAGQYRPHPTTLPPPGPPPHHPIPSYPPPHPTGTAFYNGNSLGTIVMGPLADAVGRWRILFVSSLMVVIFGLISATGDTYEFLVSGEGAGGASGG